MGLKGAIGRFLTSAMTEAIQNAGSGSQPNRIETSQDLDRWLQLEAGASRAGSRVTVDSAQQQATVFACITILRESIAHLPLPLYVRAGERRSPDRGNPLWRILHDRPNEWQTSFEWREGLVTDVELRGNHYSLKVRGVGGRLLELLPLAADRVTPKQDPQTMRVVYEYRRPNGETIAIPRRDMLHIRQYASDGVTGKGTIQQHRETIGDALAMQEHGSRYFSNGAKPLAALTLPAGAGMDINSEPVRALRQDWDSQYAGGANAYKTAVLPDGVTVKEMSISHQDSQFLESRQYNRTEIAAIFRVPPHMVGDLSRATFSNIEHQALGFVTYTLTPRLVRIEQAIHRDLLDNVSDRFVKHNVDALLRGDFLRRQLGSQIQRRNGIINANEWREREDMNPRPDDGGAEYIVESNMAPQDGGDESGEQSPSEGENDD